MVIKRYFVFYTAFLGGILTLKGGEPVSLVDLCTQKIQSHIKDLADKVYHAPPEFTSFQAFMGKVSGNYLPEELKEKVLKGHKLGLIAQAFPFSEDISDLSAHDDTVGVILKNGSVYRIDTRKGVVEQASKHMPATAIAVKENAFITGGPQGEARISGYSLQESPYKKKVFESNKDIKKVKIAGKRLFFDSPEEMALYDQQPIGSPLKRIKSYHAKAPGHSVTSDGNYYVQNTLQDKAGNPSLVSIESTDSQSLIIQSPISPEKGKVTRLTTSPHSKHALIGTTDGYVLEYDIEKGKRKPISRGKRVKQPGMITALVTTPKKGRIVSGSSKGGVRIGGRDERAVQLTQHQGGVINLVSNEEGSTLVSVGRDNGTKIFKRDKNNDYNLFEEYKTPLTPYKAVVNNSNKEQVAVAAGNLLINLHMPSSYLPQ